jgi:hypothetical protein
MNKKVRVCVCVRVRAGGDNLRGTFPSATLSTTNPTWTTLGLNLDARDERLAANFVALPFKYCDMMPGSVHC